MHIWQLQEAKAKFSRLVDEAIADGPQMVTRRGVDSVVVISTIDYERLAKEKSNLMSVLKNAPKVDLDIRRGDESIREVEL